MKTIIIGGGIMGLATAWGLARQGHDVELFEQGPLPNPLASSMDEHRLIRHPYGTHAGYARMIDEAYAAWDLLWNDLGQTLHEPTGTLALSGNGADWAQNSAATLASIGRPMTELSMEELPRRFPLLDTKGLERAFWIETGGVLLAQDIVSALASHLSAQPRVKLHAGVPIRSVDLEHGRVATDLGTTHAADVVVVAAGAWASRLVPDLAGRVVPSRQVVIYFDLPEDQRLPWAKGPMIIEKTGDVGLYLVPPVRGRGMKVGDHEFSRTGDPTAARDAAPDEMRALLDRCGSLLRGFDRWKIRNLKVCFYSVTDDERFVVEKQGGKGWVISPCSGHGFKFGAVMGLELARTIAEGRDAAAHARWAAGLAGDGPT
ncbi:FAD-dependent oxidoreductase [Reyranella aquatilis]|jgi:glycine/D-amino acid oxidase-like deaminating enzyme|uniref:FAD-dependent oxidoreductase n=1 Tax=Reyranella aquatilis TaxID=2035356 RepID=A0ABS8KR05_9HYPH|nr:FAD-dependent oxidoreductase [Reyranella aquatilis]MCC8428494.1 FAD-dependent oxidoreductase [Reyranella aquatilis]